MSLYYDSPDAQLHHGDALEVARTLPDALARTIVTSPPYFGVRDYGEAGQIGAEPSVGEYVSRMVTLFRELRRVLADDGTLWLNLGDSFSSAGGKTGTGVNARVGNALKQHDSRTRPASDLPSKNLLGVPWRVALALQDDGWILRSDIIWHKPNSMPESVSDRPTKSYEHVFLFAKSPSYFYDAEAIAEPAAKGDAGSRFDTGKTGEHQLGRVQQGRREGKTWSERKDHGAPSRHGLAGAASFGDSHFATPEVGRNKRDVWTVPTVPFPGSHFAVYPPELIRPCIRAGSEPGDIVLDPFSGSGTTGAVSNFEGRRYVGIDLNSEYLDMSLRTRFQQPTLPWGETA